VAEPSAVRQAIVCIDDGEYFVMLTVLLLKNSHVSRKKSSVAHIVSQKK